MEELLQKLQQRLDELSHEERYQFAINLLQPELALLAEWVELIEPGEDEEMDEDELIAKNNKIIKNAPKDLQKWASKQTKGIKKIRKIWNVAAALFNATFENYHQGGANACGVSEALCWLTACAIYDETKEDGFHYEQFDGLDCPEPPHLVRVCYHIALSKHSLAALAPGQIEEVDKDIIAGVSAQLEQYFEKLGSKERVLKEEKID